MKKEAERIEVRDDSEKRAFDVLLTSEQIFLEAKTKKGIRKVPIEKVIKAIPEDRRIHLNI